MPEQAQESSFFAVLRDRKPYELRSPQEHAQMLAAKHTAA